MIRILYTNGVIVCGWRGRNRWYISDGLRYVEITYREYAQLIK